MTIYPTHWPAHETIHSPDCIRCQLEADWDEQHDGCDCLTHQWDRVDIGSPAVPDLQWICGECLMVMGPAYAGGVA